MSWTLIGNKLAKVVAGFPAERQKARRIMERAIVVAKELELSNVDITQLEIPGMNALTHGLESSRSPVVTPLVGPTDVQVPSSGTSDKLTTQLLRPESVSEQIIQNDNQTIEPEAGLDVSDGTGWNKSVEAHTDNAQKTLKGFQTWVKYHLRHGTRP